MYGVNGKIIFVNLNTRKIKIEEYNEELVKKYFGGSGLAGYFFTSKFDNRANPFSPENPLFIINGLLTGTPVLTACKTSICARSPLTGIWGESTIGGFWGAELKKAGYDGIIFTGRSSSPIYLWINGSEIEIRDASNIWGKNTFEASDVLIKATHPKAKVMTIGQAGEKMFKLASIISEGGTARAAGRTGLGAVMGSKNLKGIVVLKDNDYDIKIAKKSELIKSLKEITPSVIEARQASSYFGTNGAIMGSYVKGDLPIKNWQLSSWSEDQVNKISGQEAVNQYFAKHYGCFSCPIHCAQELKWDTGLYAEFINKAPEYETAAGFGANLLIDDLKSILLANIICNDYGVDTIGASAVIAVIMEAFEREIITSKDLDGIEARWGDGEAMLKLLYKLVKGEGIGKIMADGTQSLSQWLGPIVEEFILSVKGLDFALHDPRAWMSHGLSYATSNRGACHLEGMVHSIEWGTPLKEYGYIDVDRFSFEGKGKMTAINQNYMAIFNALGLCKFIFLGGNVGPSVAAIWTNQVMGWDLTMEEFMLVGERIYNLKRLFNNRLGVTRKDDKLPPRILNLAFKEGTTAGRLPYLNKMLSDYYDFRGWDEWGIPTDKKLEELDLQYLAHYRKEGLAYKK